MKFHPRNPIVLLFFVFVFCFFNSCSKDSDLLSDAAYLDDNISVDKFGENSENEEEEGNSEDENGGSDLVIKSTTFFPENDAYIQSANGFDEPLIKLRENLRTSYLMFDLSPIDGEITQAEVELTVQSDPGDGIIEVFKGSDNSWTEENLSPNTAPEEDMLLGTLNGTYNLGDKIIIPLDPTSLTSDLLTLIMVQSVGNDLALASKETNENIAPKLIISYRTTEDATIEEDVFEEEDAGQEATEQVSGVDPGSSPCDYGSDCMTPDVSCFDSDFPEMDQWANAGVAGGIPSSLPVVLTIGPEHNLQAAIDNALASGGGVVLLTAGTYPISQTLNMRSNVVLRGVDKSTVIIESTVRGSDQDSRSIYFNNVSNAGLENLTHFYRVDGCEPSDREFLDDGGYSQDLYLADPCGMSNIRVNAIEISDSSSNNWIDNCNILESGSHPIDIEGDNNTVRNSFIDRAYNKGVGGRGYFVVSGDNNLVVKNTVKRLRHYVIQRGASYNVTYKNLFWVDVNFHNDDAGNNLVEQNTITTPSWHAWDPINTGAENYHQPPGPNNIIYNNTTDYRQTGEQRSGTPGVIYTLVGFKNVVDTGRSEPQCNTLYAMVGN